MSKRVWIGSAAGLVVSLASCANHRSEWLPGASEWFQDNRDQIAAAQEEATPEILPVTHFAAAQLLEGKGDMTGAVMQYRKAIDMNPKFVLAYNRLGLCLIKLKDYAGAAQAFEKGLAQKPDAAFLHNNLGFSLLLQHRFETAEPHFRRAVELDPAYVRARVNLALSLGQQHKYPAALQEFTMALGAPEGHFNLGLVYKSQGRFAEAGEAFRQALALQPGMAQAQAQLNEMQMPGSAMPPRRAMHTAAPSSAPAYGGGAPTPAGPAPARTAGFPAAQVQKGRVQAAPHQTAPVHTAAARHPAATRAALTPPPASHMAPATAGHMTPATAGHMTPASASQMSPGSAPAAPIVQSVPSHGSTTANNQTAPLPHGPSTSSRPVAHAPASPSPTRPQVLPSTHTERGAPAVSTPVVTRTPASAPAAARTPATAPAMTPATPIPALSPAAASQAPAQSPAAATSPALALPPAAASNPAAAPSPGPANSPAAALPRPVRIEPYSPPTPPVEPARNRLYQPPAAPRIAPYSPPAYVQPAAQHSAPVPLTLTAVSEPMPAVTASMSTTLEPRPVQIEQEPCTGELTQLHAPGLPAGGCPEDEYIDTVYPHPAEPVASWSITETGLDTIRNSLRRGRQWLISTSERLLAIAS